MTLDSPKRWLRLAAGLFLALAATAAAADVQAQLSSRFLARGEQQWLQIIVSGGQAEQTMPRPPSVPGVRIEPNNAFTKPLPGGRRLGLVFQYAVSSYELGRHVIPPISLRVDGEVVQTAPVEFVVFNPDELRWSRVQSGEDSVPYAAAFRLLKDAPYEGESVPVEIKLYVPAELAVEDWGIPEFERDGTACWRFEPSDSRGQINLLGRRYVAVGYPSTLDATRSGKVSIGGASLRLVAVRTVLDGFMRRDYVPLNLTIPKLELEARKLPPGAPAGFVNAIGRFALGASTSQTEARVGDPVSVEVAVSGTGNLDSLEAPKPVDAAGWKIYETAANPRGDERRNESGTIVFRQFMRPLADTGEIPAFKLVYFDPEKGEYQTALSKAIPLNVLPAAQTTETGAAPAGPPPAVGMPVERMTDILGLVDDRPGRASRFAALPRWACHAVAAALALVLLARAAWLRLAPRLRPDPARLARRKALKELERQPVKTDAEFLRHAGGFIERWLGADAAQDAALQAILEERDVHCYRAEKSTDAPNRSRRTRILRTLRKAAWLWPLALCLLAAQPARAADEPKETQAAAAYAAGDYDRAIRLWFETAPYDRLSAATLANIGNASYRLDSPGHAALYYRRALARDPSLAEARQNLRFLERKFGALTITHPAYREVLAKLPLATWQLFLWTGVWLIVLGLLVFPATRRGSKARVAGLVACLLGPLPLIAGALGCYYYPDDSRAVPLARQAVVIGEKAVLHADAARTSAEVIDAPPGSLCEVIKRSGRWAYVSFTRQTRGWIPAELIEPVIPDTAPQNPKIRKPKADANSA